MNRTKARFRVRKKSKIQRERKQAERSKRKIDSVCMCRRCLAEAEQATDCRTRQRSLEPTSPGTDARDAVQSNTSQR